MLVQAHVSPNVLAVIEVIPPQIFFEKKVHGIEQLFVCVLLFKPLPHTHVSL